MNLELPLKLHWGCSVRGFLNLKGDRLWSVHILAKIAGHKILSTAESRNSVHHGTFPPDLWNQNCITSLFKSCYRFSSLSWQTWYFPGWWQAQSPPPASPWSGWCSSTSCFSCPGLLPAQAMMTMTSLLIRLIRLYAVKLFNIWLQDQIMWDGESHPTAN